MEGPLKTIGHIVPIREQTWAPQAILVSDWSISKNLLLCNRMAKLKRNMVGGIYERSSIKMLILSRSVNKHGCHWQFLFLISRCLKNLLL